MPTSSQLQSVTANLSKNVASRVSRRSFLGRVGRLTMVMAAAGTVVGMTAEEAFALQCDCAGRDCDAGCSGNRTAPSGCRGTGHSVTCRGLTGVGGRCPDNTVGCGSWSCGNCSACASGVRIWTDCCATGQCSGASSCRCVRDTDGVLRRTCCNKKCYAGGGSNCSHFIRCRYARCA
jgi:hypothetical protein